MLLERLNTITELLENNTKVYVADLCKQFNVSEVTIRKDLIFLEKKGVAKRFHGGAMSARDNNFTLQKVSFVSETNDRLTEVACKEITDGDSIFLGSGKTCCVLASKLGRFQNLTVVTNNITALNILLGKVYKVYLIGGEVTTTDQNTLFSSMIDPLKYFEGIYVNKAFTSISGIDIKAGLTVNSIISTYIYKCIPKMTENWYVLADHEKFGKISMYPVSALSSIKYFICDSLDKEYQEYFTLNNIQYMEASK